MMTIMYSVIMLIAISHTLRQMRYVFTKSTVI